MMATVAEAYRQETGHDDSLVRKMAQFRRAMVGQNQKAIVTLGATVVQAFADKGVVLRRLLSEIRRRKTIDLKNPLNQFRVSLAAKFGTLYLRGGREKPTSLVPESPFQVYWIEPLAEPDSNIWFSMLQASLYGALERSYTGHPQIFTGRDCLDRDISWHLLLQLYTAGEKRVDLKQQGEQVYFHPFRKKWPVAAVSGGVQHTFNEYHVSQTFQKQVATIEITPDDLRKAKRKAHDFLKENPAIRSQRVRWLRAMKAYESEAASLYSLSLLEAFHFQSRVTELPGSELGRNPDLFLLHQFLKEIVWRKFWKQILTFATTYNSGR